MSGEIDKDVEAIIRNYGLDPNEALWPIRRKDKATGRMTTRWVMYHWAIEKVVAAAKITFDPPQIVEARSAEGCAAILVVGRLGEKAEWSIGEASPHNNKNEYPFAMAEKRAKDRVALKLLKLHGMVYSEEEGDFDPPPVNPKDTYDEIAAEILGFVDRTSLARWFNSAEQKARRRNAGLTRHQITQLTHLAGSRFPQTRKQIK